MLDNKEPITLKEHGDSKKVTLTPEQHKYIKEKINIKSEKLNLDHVENNDYNIKAKQYVGSIKIPNGNQIIIEPKINLDFINMLGYTLNIDSLQLDLNIQNMSGGNNLVELLAKFYINSVSKIIAEGIYRSYVTEIDHVSGVKGRLLLTQNIRSSHITNEKFWCEFDEISANVLENQIILFCAKTFLEFVENKKIKNELENIVHQFQKEGVEETHIESFQIDQISFQKMNLHYVEIIELCDFILHLIWYDTFSSQGKHRAYGLLCNMDNLFQDFIYKICKEVYKKEFDVVAKSRDFRLLEESRTNYAQFNAQYIGLKGKLEPDIVFLKKGTREPEFVLEIKYKRDKLDPGNFYQALAYSLTLNCPVMLFLPIFEQKKMGDFKVKPLPQHLHNISVRAVDFSPHENYIDEMKRRISKEIEDTFPELIST